MTETKPTNGLLTDRLNLTNNRRTKNRPIWLTEKKPDRNRPMTDDKLYTSLSANTIMAKLTNRVIWTRLITSSTDQHYSLDSEDDFRSGCRNVSHQQKFFSELPSPGRSQYTNYWYPWVQTIYYKMRICYIFHIELGKSKGGYIVWKPIE